MIIAQFMLPPIGSEELYLQSFLMMRIGFITEKGKEYSILNMNILTTTIMVKVGYSEITL